MAAGTAEFSGQPFPGFEAGGRSSDAGGVVEAGVFDPGEEDPTIDPLADEQLEVTRDDFF